MNTPELAVENPDSTAKALVRDLAAAGYRVGPVAELLGPVALSALGRDQVRPADRVTTPRVAVAAAAAVGALGGAEPLAVLTRLWLLGRPVPRSALDRALPTTGTTGAEALGLVQAAGEAPDDVVRPLLELSPYAADDAEWWLASDLTHTGRPLRPDHVLGVGGASTTLARWTPRDPVGTALDIGTGCGVQAFHLATHAAAVTATDTSRRCLRVTRLNARLNAAVDGGPFAGRRLDLLGGSLLAPVGGQEFDLVVSNPPYVITPRGRVGTDAPSAAPYTYRDGGQVGDDIVRQLVEGVGSVLAPGGTAQLLGNWEHRRGEGWRDRVSGWLERSVLHGWVVQREVQDPAEYAETWARDGGHAPGTAEHDAMYDAWLDDFAARGVEAIGFGVITLRRPAGDRAGDAAGHRPRIRRVEEHTGPTAEAMGPTVAAVLAAEEWLLGATDADLARTRLVVADDVTEERFGRPGADDPQVIRLAQGGGLRRSVRVDTALAAVVGACDGELALGALTAAVAELLGEDAGPLHARVLPAVRRLVADGLLLA